MHLLYFFNISPYINNGDTMKNWKKFLIVLILFLAIISISSIYSASGILGSDYTNLYIKQIIWYIICFSIIFLINKIKNNFILNHIWLLYIFGNILLFLLLFFGKEINYAKCWFEIPFLGTFQPSEFMKIILILTLSCFCDNFYKNNKKVSVKQEFIFIIKTFIIVLIPSILTFLEPDTGAVLIYFIITIVILFISGIRYRWFFIGIAIVAIVVGSILYLYFYQKNTFISILGNDFFLRVERLLDWSNQDGFQLQKGITAIGSAGVLGHGFYNTPLYFPEAETDFIFAVYSSNFGFIGSLFLFVLLFLFDFLLISVALKAKKQDKLIIAGTIGMLIYQQVQNIGMTYGVLPITGITLPFISYGGSSLFSYMIIIGIILNIKTRH